MKYRRSHFEGKKDVLGLWIAETEGAKFWMGVLNELKNRGVEDILIACMDGLTGFPDAVKELCGAEVEVVKRNELHTFAVLPKRWVVERTFGWLDKARRLWKNCEHKMHNSGQMLVPALIAVLINSDRLHQYTQGYFPRFSLLLWEDYPNKGRSVTIFRNLTSNAHSEEKTTKRIRKPRKRNIEGLCVCDCR